MVCRHLDEVQVCLVDELEWRFRRALHWAWGFRSRAASLEHAAECTQASLRWAEQQIADWTHLAGDLDAANARVVALDRTLEMSAAMYEHDVPKLEAERDTLARELGAARARLVYLSALEHRPSTHGWVDSFRDCEILICRENAAALAAQEGKP
jgi:hypothetical protein